MSARVERRAFDERLLDEASRAIAARLFARFPELRPHAAMEHIPGRDGWCLLVTAPAPSGEPGSALRVWMEGGEEPSVGFGDFWHTHTHYEMGASDEPDELLEIVQGVLEDRIVAYEELDARGRMTRALLLDPSDKSDLIDELTAPGSRGEARLRSWSGRLDRRVTLAELDAEDSR